MIPAVKRFEPDFIIVSSGFDASYADSLGAMMLSSECFGQLAASLVSVAESCCSGRIVFAHEGRKCVIDLLLPVFYPCPSRASLALPMYKLCTSHVLTLYKNVAY